jgi:hypothetical protein
MTRRSQRTPNMNYGTRVAAMGAVTTPTIPYRTPYEVVESKLWQSKSGRRVSIYGSLPWYSEAQRVAEGWEMVVIGYTIYDPTSNQYGIGRVPWKTRELAQEWVDTRNPELLPR